MTYFSGDPLIRYPTYPNFKKYVKTLILFYLILKIHSHNIIERHCRYLGI